MTSKRNHQPDSISVTRRSRLKFRVSRAWAGILVAVILIATAAPAVSDHDLLPWEELTTHGIAPAGEGQGFNVVRSDLAFILEQIKIAEAHAASSTVSDPCGTIIGTGPDQIPAGPNAHLLSLGLRTISGICNNLVPGQETFGAADQPFPRLAPADFREADNVTVDWDFGGPLEIGDDTSYIPTSGIVEDHQPRLASNLVVDQTVSNPAAVLAADGAPPDGDGLFFIPNVAPDAGLSAPFNNTFIFFGQFFDHGLDLITKTGDSVFMPLLPDDPLFDPMGPNFMTISRATNPLFEPINNDTPFVDQQQTYASHPSHHVFLREYEFNGDGEPVATGKMLTGDPVDGGLADWEAVKASAATFLGIMLDDDDVLSVPVLATDLYGKFIPGPTGGFPQIISPGAVGGMIEGDPSGGGIPVPFDAEPTGHAFLVDLAHHADPGPGKMADADGTVCRSDDAVCVATYSSGAGPPNGGKYDDEMLNEHFICGDGRCNENIALSSIHHVFHSEHNRLVDDIKAVLEDPPADPNLAEWEISPGVWNGERLLQAARFITEMEYQHLAFEEFGRKVQPGINEFGSYDATIDAAISMEFGQAVYRFGHSMLPEILGRFNAPPGVHPNDIKLLDAFLNPPAFFEDSPMGPPTLTPNEGAAAFFRGLTVQRGNEIDEFVTEAVRNTLLGLPLDLPAINMARGRDTGVPRLNNARRAYFAATGDTSLSPYMSWIDFGLSLRNLDSLANFIAAYGTHPDITGEPLIADKRAVATAMVAVGAIPDYVDFINSVGVWANDPGGISITGVEDIDSWLGGIAEKPEPGGGLLGSTNKHVFETQMEALQDGDRFYYLLRTEGMNLLVQLEGNSFSEMIERNTGAENLPADVFSQPTYFFNADVQGSVPGSAIVDDPDTTYDETALLTREADGTIRYAGEEHTNWGSTDASGDRIRSGAGDDTVRGADGDDVLEGGPGGDNLIGGKGNDILTDESGEDDFKAGDGNDVVSSGNGIDLIQGGRGDDALFGGTDGNEFLSGEGDDVARGGDAGDDLHGDANDDWLEGAGGDDNVEGDSGLEIIVEDIIVPGDDVLNGNGGNDRYFGEGGDDILLAGTGAERFFGQFGFDWVSHYGDPQPADADLLIDVFAPPGAEMLDRFRDIEGVSGWMFDDTLRGDDATDVDMVDHELDSDGIDNITGLSALLMGASDFTGGNIIIGGDGSDILEGRGGDDRIDGDAFLTAQLEAPIPGMPGMTQLVDSVFDLQADLLAGLIDPGDIDIVRTIEPGDPASGTDSAVFSGPLEDYTLTIGIDVTTVEHTNPGAIDDGLDTLTNIELLVFDDQVVPIQGGLFFSTLGSVDVPGVGGTADDADIYSWSPTFARVWDASDPGGPLTDSDVDGLTVLGPDHFFLSFNGDETVPLVGAVEDEDVLEYSAGVWSVKFDGTTKGLTTNGHDLDAVHVDGFGDVYFSTVGNSTVGGIGSPDDADVYVWDGLTFSRVFDATAAGLAGGADVDGLTVAGSDHFYLSFKSEQTVPDVGTVQVEDVVEYDAGVWSLFFDGTSQGLGTDPGLDVDAISIDGVGLAGGDTTDPIWTAGIVTASNETNSTVDLVWSGASDDVGVVAYNVYQDGGPIPIATVPGTSITVTGLDPDTTYLFLIEAEDAAGNESTTGPSTMATTAAAPGGFSFSTLGNTAVPGVGGTADDADVYSWNGASFGRIWDATLILGSGADVDGLTVLGPAHFLLSFNSGSTTVPGIAGTVQDEDVVEYISGAFTLFFDGTGEGLTSGGRDIDALHVDGSDIYFSTLGNNAVPGVSGVADDADIYLWNGLTFTRVWDATVDGGLPGGADVDGLTVLGPGHFLLSFNSSSTTVPGLGTVQDEDVVEYTAGTFTLFFDGTSEGLTTSGLDVDAISIDLAPDLTAPAAPTGLVATAGDGSVSLDWADNGEPDLASYNVYRSTTTGGPYTLLAAGTGVTVSDFVDMTAANGTEWFYVVTAVDVSANESLDSNEDSATPMPDMTAPAAPTGLVATPGDGLVSLDWDDNGEPDLASYNVYRGTVSGGPYTLLAAGTGVTVSDFVDGTAVNGTEWFYVVTAVDVSANESLDSNEDSATPMAAGAVSLFFSTFGNGNVGGLGSGDDADVYSFSPFARVFDANPPGPGGLPGGADVDALMVLAPNHFFVSFLSSSTTVPGLGTVQDEDILEYNAGAWTVFFDGTSAGLTSGGRDIDAVHLDGTDVYFSTSGTTSVGGLGSGDDADIYKWDGAVFTRVWDASLTGGLAGSADVDGLTVIAPNHFFLSFNSTSTSVPGLGTVQDEDIVEYLAGTFTLFFDGTSEGLTGSSLDLDAISIP